MTSTPTAVLVEEKCGAKGKLSSKHDNTVEGDLTGRQVHQHVIISVSTSSLFQCYCLSFIYFPFIFFFFFFDCLYSNFTTEHLDIYTGSTKNNIVMVHYDQEFVNFCYAATRDGVFI